LRPNRFRSRPPAACTSEADGRLCRNARLPDMCERPRANAKAALSMARAPSFFTMSNSPPRGVFRTAHLVPAAHFLRPGRRVVVLCLHRISAALGRRFGGARAQILGVSCSSDPEMRGRRSAGRRTTLIRRAGKTRPHACEACPSRATGTSASRRSTVALPGPRCVSGISAGAGATLARRPSFMAGYGPRVRPRLRAAADATPAPPSGSSLETPLMSEMTNPVLYIRYVVKK
jgi:hypothetical protein